MVQSTCQSLNLSLSNEIMFIMFSLKFSFSGTHKSHSIRSIGNDFSLESRKPQLLLSQAGEKPCANEEHISEWKKETLIKRFDKKAANNNTTDEALQCILSVYLSLMSYLIS